MNEEPPMKFNENHRENLVNSFATIKNHTPWLYVYAHTAKYQGNIHNFLH